MKRTVCLILVLLLSLASVPFAAADQEAEGTVVSLESGILTLELENGNVAVMNCDIDTNACAGDKVRIMYVGKLGISAAVTDMEILSANEAFTGTVTEVYGDHFTVSADTGARITFMINADTTLSGSSNGLRKGMEVSVTFSGDITENVYAENIRVLSSPAVPAPTEEPAKRSPVRLHGRPVNRASSLSVGDIVTFGSYEQDGYSGNGKEDIEWRVLDIKGNSVLLLSEYALDMHVYNNETVRTTWESSSIRAFLNGNFYNVAFNNEEKEIIKRTHIDNSAAQGDRESLGGPGTNDNVFLLSYQEAWYYLPSAYDRMCVPTNYALQRFCMSSGKYQKNGTGTTYWWLRSSGRTDIVALLVMSDGSEGFDNVSWGYNASDNMYHSGGCIRPAVWVSIG